MQAVTDNVIDYKLYIIKNRTNLILILSIYITWKCGKTYTTHIIWKYFINGKVDSLKKKILFVG